MWRSKYTPLLFFELHNTSCCLSVYLWAIRHIIGGWEISSLQSHTDTSKALIVYPLPLIERCCLWERNIDSSQKIGEAQENLSMQRWGCKGEQVDSLGLWQTMKIINIVSSVWSLISERNLIDCCDISRINQLINSVFILIRKNRINLNRNSQITIS